MHVDMRDVAFSFCTKTGLVKMRESRLADTVLGGKGLTAMSSSTERIDYELMVHTQTWKSGVPLDDFVANL